MTCRIKKKGSQNTEFRIIPEQSKGMHSYVKSCNLKPGSGATFL